MDITQSAILGAVQGFGEFLPISSSAHLAVIPKLLGWDYQGISYDVMLHLGTLAALLLCFKSDWTEIITQGIKSPSSPGGRTLWLLALATIPAGIAGLFLEHAAERQFRNPALIAATLILFAGALYYADSKNRAPARQPQLNLKTALIIGLAQALSIVPGVSRSGITITAALLLGFSRAESARISFLLSAPIILGAGLTQIKHVSISQINAEFLTGLAVAFITGWIAIRFLMSYVRTRSYTLFVVYRILLGLFILRQVLF